jgi:3',5'-nucleoside bisphosphate phosphatase
MKIDLHVHSLCSDGKFSPSKIIAEATHREIGLLSITDHDTIDSQIQTIQTAKLVGLSYISGVELNVTFSHSEYKGGKQIPLDFLGYQFDSEDEELRAKLLLIAKHRKGRAAKILENINAAFRYQGINELTEKDFYEIQDSADGTLGRPHIADYLVKKGIVKNRQEAFDLYLVECDVPKYPLYLEDASRIVRNAGGKLVLAHPNDPHGTSLATLTPSLPEQTRIIQECMLTLIDGVECWHPRNDIATTSHYVHFAEENSLFMTGGSDCHQKPILMGTVEVPDWVATQFQVK